MVQASTPTFVLTFPSNVDLSVPEHIVFSLVQGYFELHKVDTGITVDSTNKNIVTVELTQEDTLNFSEHEKAELQLNWSYLNGKRGHSNIVEIEVGKNLYKVVIS